MDLHRLTLACRGFPAARGQTTKRGGAGTERMLWTTSKEDQSIFGWKQQPTSIALSAAAVNEPSSRPEITTGQQTAVITLVRIGGGRRKKKEKASPRHMVTTRAGPHTNEKTEINVAWVTSRRVTSRGLLIPSFGADRRTSSTAISTKRKKNKLG